MVDRYGVNMIEILATYQDEVYLSSEIKEMEDSYSIKRGYKGNLQERFNGVVIAEPVIISKKDVFYIMKCFDPQLDQENRTFARVNIYNPMIPRLINHSKKLSAAYLMATALSGIKKPLLFRQIVARCNGIKRFHHVTYTRAVDEVGFLFGLEKVYGKRFILRERL